MQGKYKKFTVSIQTPTLLDDFAPTSIEAIEKRFIPIKALQERYCNDMQRHAKTIKGYQGFENVAIELINSAKEMQDIFADFESRMKYFTLVFFGAVSAGKTSLICDLANTSPRTLNNALAKHPDFDQDYDQVIVGPNVATVNLYEILIEKSCIRLVDVPGIGGVSHDDDTLAPFVNMADCIVFLLNASNDITRNDDDFLFKQVADVQRYVKDGKEFLVEERLDKKVLVILNKWNSAYRNFLPAHAKKTRDQKTQWILYGDTGKGFDGIAGYFRKPPEIVCSNTKERDETGEPCPNSAADLTEVVSALREIFTNEGAELRIERPKQIMARELNRLTTWLIGEKSKRSLQDIERDLENMGGKITFAAAQVNNELTERLARLEQTIDSYLKSRIKPVVYEWEPNVGFFEGIGGIFDKDGMQKGLQERWGNELRELIMSRVNATDFEALIKRDIEAFKSFAETNFQIHFLDKQCFHDQLTQQGANLPVRLESHVTISTPKGTVFDELNYELSQIVEKIEMGIMTDIFAVLKWDIILALVAGAILSPVSSFVVMAWRRWQRGKSKGHEAKQELDRSIDKVTAEVAAKVRNQIAGRLQQGIEELHKNIKTMLDKEKTTETEPLKAIDQVMNDLQRFQTELVKLSK